MVFPSRPSDASGPGTLGGALAGRVHHQRATWIVRPDAEPELAAAPQLVVRLDGLTTSRSILPRLGCAIDPEAVCAADVQASGRVARQLCRSDLLQLDHGWVHARLDDEIAG
jgi:hypothetical protein